MSDEKDTERAAVNDVVQIDPDFDPVFGGCLMVVTEVRSWGYQGHIPVAQPPDGGFGQVYYRAPFDRVVRIGKAEWVLPNE